ncbi:hypothetical protein N6H14_13135 [Paenibacillus sp. CC-CFT747]|nr:hypothetical protein N6H14_13135 [Paenibacillus sp. CC-CFT747]
MKKKKGLIGLALLVILVFLTAPVQPSLSAGRRNPAESGRAR